MNAELPKYIFSKKFEHHFLFFDTEVYMNKQFYNNIQKFSETIGGTFLNLQIFNPKNNSIMYDNSLSLKNHHALSKLTNEKINDITVEDYMFKFFIKDDTHKWELYCNLGHDIAICGCMNEVKKLFENIVNPYREISFTEKFEEIMLDKNITVEYFKDLENNYFSITK